jgi:hypothetical protein
MGRKNIKSGERNGRVLSPREERLMAHRSATFSEGARIVSVPDKVISIEPKKIILAETKEGEKLKRKKRRRKAGFSL